MWNQQVSEIWSIILGVIHRFRCAAGVRMNHIGLLGAEIAQKFVEFPRVYKMIKNLDIFDCPCTDFRAVSAGRRKLSGCFFYQSPINAFAGM